MNMFNEMRRAVAEAEHVQRAVDANASDMARLLAGRLRQVRGNSHPQGVDCLRALKKELTQFNARTGRWKS